MSPIRIKSFIAVLAVVLASACQSPRGEPMGELATEINATLSPPQVRIGPGDSILVRFSSRVDWNHAAVVRPDGVASFLVVDEIEVGGMLPLELDEQLTKAYADILPDPDLTLEVTPIPRTVAVLGEVDEAGQFELTTDRPMTLLDAIALAGGFDSRTAFLGDVVLVRWIPEDRRQQTWLIDACPEQWGLGDPVFLQPYDVIYVPNKTVDRVNIWVDQYIRLMIPFPYLVRPY